MLNVNTATKSHQSVKKAGVNQPGTPHISVDNGSDVSADDDIEESIEQPSVIAASLVVGALIVVPLSVALLVTVCARLHKQGSAPICCLELQKLAINRSFHCQYF